MNQSWIDQLPIKGIMSAKPVSGGYMNKAYCLQTKDRKYFMKVQPNKGKRFFKYEVDGVKLISQAVLAPKVVCYGQVNNDGYLIYDWDNFADFKKGDQYKLGQAVAHLHLIHHKRFGFNYGFHLGPIPKPNTWQDSWIKFYVDQRLDISVKMLQKENLWNQSREDHYQRMRSAFIAYYSESDHKVIPSLLHGDLWTGNCGFLTNGKPILFDPNVIYGDRELDLAMTTLKSSIANFNQDFYKGYNSVYPIKPGFKKRVPWYQFLCEANASIIFHKIGSLDKILSHF